MACVKVKKQKLLNESGIPSRIADRRIGVNDEDRYLLETTLTYLETHPELRNS
jgi:hypothetical protein